jgi:hypothetical protein
MRKRLDFTEQLERLEDNAMPLCKGFTKRKGNCHNIVSCGDFCWRHKPVQKVQTTQTVPADDVPAEVETNECAICLNTINPESLHTTVCKHVFHKNCMMQWKEINREKKKKLTCPCCRGDLFDKKEAEKELLEKIDGIVAILIQFADYGTRSEQWSEYGLRYLDYFNGIASRDLVTYRNGN